MTKRIDRAIATLDAEIQEQWRVELRGLQRACGCREALAGMLIAATAAGYFAYSNVLANVALTIGGAALGGALIGKVAGLLFARIRLHVLLHKIGRPIG
jgi:hypothetical protein